MLGSAEETKISIVIPMYNMVHLVKETLWICALQKYPNKEIIVYDDCSTDNVGSIDWEFFGAKYYRGMKNVGVGEAFNAGIRLATGDIIVLMCADDLFTNEYVLWDIYCNFKAFPGCGVIVRYYYQFINGDDSRRPVRAWRSKNPVVLANNPSGLAFRAEALIGLGCSNRMFIETSFLVKQVTEDLWGWCCINYDAIAARVHSSTSTTPGYWLKRRVSSPVMDWWALGAKEIAMDFSSLIQIKNGFKTSAVLEEIWNFVRLRPLNLLHPSFYFYIFVSLLIPRTILRKIPDIYRRTWGRWTTKAIVRPTTKQKEPKKMLLNLGAGKTQRKDCINVDVTDYPGIDKVVDLSVYPWPWADGSVDGIHADHVIEHLPDQKQFILECLRVLKKGGFLRMRLPHSSSPSGIGCFGHYRTFSYNTLNCYLGSDFYMFGKAPFKTVEQKLLWWYETGDSYGLVPLPIWIIICIANPIINFFIRLSPEIFENFWWAYVGGAKEVVWKGEKV